MVNIGESLKNLRNMIGKHYLIMLVILFFVASHYAIVKDYTALPSPIYGGDLYFQLGATNHVKYGGNPLDSSNVNGSLPAYFVTYSFLSGNIAKIFNTSALNAELILSYITLIVSLIVIYVLINKIFKNRYLAAICAIIYNIPIEIVFKYTTLANRLVTLAIILALYVFLEKENYRNAIILGILYGVAGLTHSVLFMSISLLLAIVFPYYIIVRNKHHFLKKDYKKIFQSVAKYALVILIGVTIAMLWWFKPVFYYHGATASHYTEIQQDSLDKISQQLNAAKYMFTAALVNFHSAVKIFYSLFIIAGFILLFATKNSEEKRFISVLFFSAIIINLHFFITYNLFGFHLIPSYMTYLLVAPISVLVFAFGLHVLSGQIKNKKYVDLLLTLIIVILVVMSIPSTVKHNTDQWGEAAKKGLPEYMSNLQDFLVKNTDVYDTILSTNEISFAVNSISGRKVMVSRRAHNDPFMDIDRRQIDAAIMLYGNDTEKKLELIKKYNVKYVYWDYYWINSEFQMDNTGKITGWFDPLLVTKDYSSYVELERYDVKYFQENTWVDPTMRHSNIKKFDVIIVSPQNYDNFTNPWRNDLDPYLEEVWSYEQSGQKIAILYKVKV